MPKSSLILGYVCAVLPIWLAFRNPVLIPHPYKWQYDTMALPKPKVPLDNPMTEEGVVLGRLLFYDSILSVNNRYSCGSCHQQKYSFSDGKRLAIGYKGDTLTRNTLALINLAWVNDYFWDGRRHSLEELVFDPITDPKEMGETVPHLLNKLNTHAHYPRLFEAAFGTKMITKDLIAKAISQFLRTIVSEGIRLPDEVLNMPPEGMSEPDFVNLHKTDTTLRATYFRFANLCGSCHITAVYGGELLGNNGIMSRDINTKIPALINVTETAPYMHDGSIDDIREVVAHYEKVLPQLKERNPELEKIGAFRKYDDKDVSLTTITEFDKKHIKEFMLFFRDTALLNNQNLQNPFKPSFKWLNEQ